MIGTFIAYQGKEYDFKDIKIKLDEFNNNKPLNVANIKVDRDNKIIFGKIVSLIYLSDLEPYTENSILVVGGYEKTQLNNLIQRKYDRYKINDPDKCHLLFNKLYCNKVSIEQFLKDLSKDIDFAVAIYDANNKKFIVARGNGNNYHPDNELFYGFTKRNSEIMFSNSKSLLMDFCNPNTIKDFPVNSYYSNGEFYSYIESKRTKSKGNTQLIPNTPQNAKNLIDGLNLLLMQITNESLRQEIEATIEEYLGSDDSKNKINEYITTTLDTDTKKHILELIEETIRKYDINNTISKTLNEKFDAILEEYMKTKPVPVNYIVKLKDTELGRSGTAFFHEKFEEILEEVQLDEPVMLIGPAGSGKNYTIEQVSKALGKKMYYTNNASNEFKLTGFIDAGGIYRETEFYRAFKNGGIFFLDEIDNSDPSALIVINSALANGYIAFPHETIERHKDFRIVAAANTWGKGSDLEYVGRNVLDAATLDRFDNIFFDYDRKLEASLYPSKQVLDYMWAFRDAVYKSKIPHIISTRGIGKVYKKEINGVPVERILLLNVIKNLKQDDVNTILGNMKDINNSNKYYQATKVLRLGR